MAVPFTGENLLRWARSGGGLSCGNAGRLEMHQSHRNVAVLSPYGSAIAATIMDNGDKVFLVQDADLLERDWDWVISYGHRTIFPAPVVERYKNRMINLHTAYLPWNRGAHPNVWSWVDDTPKGVTIHYIDRGIDTGDIIAQREVHFNGGETLATSYDKLQSEMERLFDQVWPDIRNGGGRPQKQEGQGTFHRAADIVALSLPLGWDTPVSELRRMRQRAAASRAWASDSPS